MSFHNVVQLKDTPDLGRHLGDEPLGQRRMDTPVAPFVGIGQRRAPDRLAEAHVIEFRCVDREAGLDVAQAFPVGQLGTDDNGNPSLVIIRLDDDAAALFQEWREANASREADASGLYLSHIGKLPGMVLRLALVLEFLWWVIQGDEPEPETVASPRRDTPHT